LSNENDAALTAIMPLVEQAALEGQLGIKSASLEFISKQAMKRGAHAQMPVRQILAIVRAVAVDEPKQFTLAPAKAGQNRRERAKADLERTEAFAAATRRPTPTKEPKFSKATKRNLHKFGGAMALLDSVNYGKAPEFLTESNVGEGE
jgi:hypothetical protein